MSICLASPANFAIGPLYRVNKLVHCVLTRERGKFYGRVLIEILKIHSGYFVKFLKKLDPLRLRQSVLLFHTSKLYLNAGYLTYREDSYRIVCRIRAIFEDGHK